ncbi:baeRF6 domain-containing protein [Loigolactobacillus zhaoyuanensis]|uniref:Bacterial archaeo-eukaryotic release factor family 6 domain-containing protein n=1 Tax=Loigolactobacillus zhaoyuanensis TaxID=2486017 RepID=A0ABW8UAZ1_9LACO
MAALQNDLAQLIQAQGEQGPFVSIFMKVSPYERDIAEDKATFRNLVQQAKKTFISRFTEKAWAGYHEQFTNVLQQQRALGNNGAASIVVVVGQADTFIYPLAQEVANSAHVGDTVYALPLIANDQFSWDYHLLKVSQDSIALWDVTEGVATPVELPAEAPTTRAQALGTELTNGKTRTTRTGLGAGQAVHGNDPKEASQASDTQNYFKQVDDYVLANYSKTTQKPLVLLAVSENQAVFRKLSKNKYLLKNTELSKVPAKLDRQTVAQIIAQINQQLAAEVLAVLQNEVDRARSAKKYISDFGAITQRVTEGNVDTLFIAADAYVAGRLVAGELDTSSAAAKATNLLNELSVEVLQLGGQVYVLPESELQADATAILRRPDQE